jgi:hypothetical protein
MKSKLARIMLSACAAVAAALALDSHAISPRLHAQAAAYPPPIVSITVDDAAGNDTHKIVLAPKTATCTGPFRSPVPPGRCPINTFDHLGVTSDEMQTVFAPGTLGANEDYLFWVATSANGSGIGSVALSGGSGPDADGWWTLRFAKKDGYGIYSNVGGPVLMPVVGGTCLDQNLTFDSNYAAPGTVVKDPQTPGRLLMIYEGVNVCSGVPINTNPSHNAYIVTALATSSDYGLHWPLYVNPANQQVLPSLLPTPPTPNFPDGAFGSELCEGNCDRPDAPTPPVNYGRYPILSPTVPLATLMSNGTLIDGDIGDGEPSAFLDDVNSDTPPYLYVVHGYSWKKGLGLYELAGRQSDLTLAQAPLTADPRLNFKKWYAATGSPGSFSEAGSVFDASAGSDTGGMETPILPVTGAYENCADSHQSRHMGAISYVEPTHQYMLTFVCSSPSDPSRTDLTFGLSCNPKDAGDVDKGCGPGASWFFATSYDPADPAQWSQPQPITGQSQPRAITGSWSQYDPVACTGNGFKGLYPTFMSPSHESGHLSTSGYVFYMWGCEGGGESRLYSARQFKITTTDTTPPVTTASVSGPAGLDGWYLGRTVVTFSATDDLSGVAETQSSLDGGQTWVSGTSRTLDGDGMYTVEYRSIDIDGNVELAQSLVVKIDSTPPATGAIGQYLDLPGIGAVSFRVTLTAQDAESGVARTLYSLDNGATWTEGTTFLLGGGSYTVLFYSVDVAGNQESIQSASFTVDLPAT